MSHLNDLYEITRNKEVMKYIGNLKPWSYDKTKRFINYGNSDDYYYNGIFIDEYNRYKLIGVIGKHNDKLTIYINPKYHHRGYGKKALQLFMNNVTSKLYADVLKNNKASIALFIRYPYIELDNIYRFTLN